MNIKKTVAGLCCCALPLLLCLCGGSDKDGDKTSPLKSPLCEARFSGEILFHSNMDGDNEIYSLTSDGLVKLTDNDWNDEFPVWSPDGGRIAFTSDREGHYDIYTMEGDGGNVVRRTDFTTDEKDPSWFPDGDRIAFSREFKRFIGKKINISVVDLNSGRKSRLIPGLEQTHGIPHVSPDGVKVAMTVKRRMGWDAAVYDLEKKEMTYLGDSGKTCRGRFAPDGKTVAFVSSEADGKGDIWLAGADGSAKKRLTLRDDSYDYFPSWSPGGKRIVFNSSVQHDLSGDWELLIVDPLNGEIERLFDSPGNDVFPCWKQEPCN